MLPIVCGFAFDPHVSEEAKRYGRLTVLVARMNPDLSMGDELLQESDEFVAMLTVSVQRLQLEPDPRDGSES